jgi:nucleoside-diphosphate-sugar epimerase
VRVLIIGCGYVGLPLGAELARLGHDVHGICRTANREAAIIQAGVRPVIADITERGSLEQIDLPFDWVVNTLSSSKGGVEDYRAVYLAGTRRIIQWLSAQPPKKYVYTSSTSVYAQMDGSSVGESSETTPNSETSRILVETERLLTDAAKTNDFPAVILRVAGIYGPERGHLFQQYLRGEARIEGDGSRLINMVHRDDVVRAIVAALERGQAGDVYNVADDEPVTQHQFFAWLSGQLHLPMPPATENPASLPRKRTVTNKRVSNRKLRLELGCELRYPTFRQGYSAEIARLQAAGQLPVGAGQ